MAIAKAAKRALWLKVWPILALSGVAWAQGQAAEEPFSEVTQVTGRELVVGLPPVNSKYPLLLKKPPVLEVGDFSLMVDGRRVELTSLTRAGERPWRFLLYVDSRLSTSRQVRWMAETVMAELATLLELGSLEIVVARPEPEVVLAPTRSESNAREALSGLALTESTPNGVEELRRDFLQAQTRELGMPPAVFASQVLTEESRIVSRQMDRLLNYLAEGVATPGLSKALLLASGAVDLVPSEFYREALGPSGLGGLGPTQLRSQAGELARNVAALGWVTVGLDGPEPEALLLRGKRIGKWRFKIPAWSDPAFIVVREAERDPDLAEAHLERGRASLDVGQPIEAQRELEAAIHHYQRDPRTADRQAIAWRDLGRALEELGSPGAALRASKTAARLDPELVPLYADLVASEATERSMLEEFARAGLGWTVTGPDELADVLESCGRLLVLAYETQQLHDGRLHPLAVRRLDADEGLISSRWSPSGTSEAVAAARVRRLVAENDLETGCLEAEFELLEGPERRQVEVVVESPAPAISSLRVSVGVVTPHGVEVAHATAERVEGGSLWKTTIGLPSEVSGPLIAVAEDVITGCWTADWFDR